MYLNAAERENIMRCAMIKVQADHLLDSKHDRWLPSRKWIKTIRTLAEKTLVSAVRDVDKDQAQSLQRYINNCDFEIKFNSAKVAQNQDMLTIPMDMFLEMRDLYMVDCIGCEKDKHAIKKCELRRKLLRFGLIMPGKDPNTKPCPFKEELL